MELRPPVVLPHLLALLRAGPGTEDERIDRALEVMVEELGIETAFVSRFDGGRRRITHLSGREVTGLAGVPTAVEETVCRLIVDGAVGPLVPDTAANPLLRAHPHVTAMSLGAYVGVPLVVRGQVAGAVCGVATGPRPSLNERDADRLLTVARYVADLLAGTPAPDPVPVAQPSTPAVAEVPTAPVPTATLTSTELAPVPVVAPAPMADPAPAHIPVAAPAPARVRAPRLSEVDLPELAAALVDTDSLETLTRPLLELLHSTTGLESTSLTLVDWVADEQRVVHSFSPGALVIPEGMTVRWSDTLCRRSLEAGTPYTRDVPGIWGDSEAARALGIQTYVSVPITDADEAVIGTLCGVSTHGVDLDEKHVQSMQLFARILADQINREKARERETVRARELEQRTLQLRDAASRDSLTGLVNRRGIHSWLDFVAIHLRPGVEQLAVAFIDVDDFKTVNDIYGHAAGDEVLRRIALSLMKVGRPGDLHGRLGGDEFVVAAILPATEATLGNWTHRLQRAAATTHLDRLLVTASVGVAVFTDPDVTGDHALHLADQAMYQQKPRRRARA